MFVLAGLGLLGAATALVLAAFNDNLVFFYGPSDLASRIYPPGRRIRIGGLVEAAQPGARGGQRRAERHPRRHPFA